MLTTNEGYLSPKDIAQRLGVTQATVINYIKRGQLKGRKLGGQWRVRVEDYLKFIQDGDQNE